MGTLASGSIDLKSLKVAGSSATSYITTIDGGGISVHDVGDNNNFIKLTSSGMQIYKGGSADANKVAEFSDSVQIGKSGTAHINITSGGLDLYKGATGLANLVAHLGYGASSSTIDTNTVPYFTLGSRAGSGGVATQNYVPGESSVVMGQAGLAAGRYSISVGYQTEAVGDYSFAEGTVTYAIGQGSHAEGSGTYARGTESHAGGQGSETLSTAPYSFVHGEHLIASARGQAVFGRYNSQDNDAIFIVGNGSSTNDNDRSNIFTITGAGDLIIKDGFKITNETGNQLQLSDEGIDVFKNNDDSSNLNLISVAKFGDIVRIGKELDSRVEIDENGIFLFTKDQNSTFMLKTNGSSHFEDIWVTKYSFNKTSKISYRLPSGSASSSFPVSPNNMGTQLEVTIEAFIHSGNSSTKSITTKSFILPTSSTTVNYTYHIPNGSSLSIAIQRYAYNSSITILNCTYTYPWSEMEQSDSYINITTNRTKSLENILVYDPVLCFGNITETSELGGYSSSFGKDTIAASDYQTTIGKYNETDSNENYAFIIGNGTSNSNRSNAFAVDWDGDVLAKGGINIAVEEIGSNYIRYSNGIQICWINTSANVAMNTAYGNLYQGSYTWNFPKAFNASPTVTVGAMRWGTGASWGTLGGAPSTTQAILRGIDVTSRASGSTHIEAMAIGYWQ